MDAVTVAERVKQVIVEQLGLPKDYVTMPTELLDLGLDKLDIIELVFALQDEFDILIGDDKIGEEGTVEKIIAVVRLELDAK